METGITRTVTVILIALMLVGCKGVGMSKMSSDGFFEDSEEEKGEEKFWDKLYGRKPLSRESSDWKDFYSAPNQDETKPDYCGFWGNCAAPGSAAPANCNFYGNCDASAPQATEPEKAAPAASCDFYGNCSDEKSGGSWW